jgi:hypothetical protein
MSRKQRPEGARKLYVIENAKGEVARHVTPEGKRPALFYSRADALPLVEERRKAGKRGDQIVSYVRRDLVKRAKGSKRSAPSSALERPAPEGAPAAP